MKDSAAVSLVGLNRSFVATQYKNCRGAKGPDDVRNDQVIREDDNPRQPKDYLDLRELDVCRHYDIH
jgi:hypothetical protein